MIRSELVQKLCDDHPDLTRGGRTRRPAFFDSITEQLQGRPRRAARLRRLLDAASATPARAATRAPATPSTSRQARALFQAGQGNARALKPAGSDRGISRAGSTVALAASGRTWRNGRRWGLKILFPIRECGFKSRRPHHAFQSRRRLPSSRSEHSEGELHSN